jgi:hypothetical protein
MNVVRRHLRWAKHGNMQLDQGGKNVIVSIAHLSQFARSRDLRLCFAYGTLGFDVFLQLSGNLVHLPQGTISP